MNKFKGDFNIKFSRDKRLWYWTLSAANGEILCTSELFNSKQSAQKGIRAVKRIAIFAPVHDTTEVRHEV
jgi:uncharacterized protein YegP (UPF0339 family)